MVRLYTFREVGFEEYLAEMARARGKFGLTREEEGVLGAIGGYGIHSRPDELAKEIWDEDEGAKDRLELVALRAAVQLCIAKGWVKILTAEDCERDKRWRATDPYPMTVVSDYEPGQVTLTNDGEKLYADYSQYVTDHTAPNTDWQHRVGWRTIKSEKGGRFEIYGADKDLCHQVIGEIICFPSPYLGGGNVQVTGIEPPAPIGPFRLGRFNLIFGGALAVITYSRKDESMPSPYWVQLPRRQ